MHISNTVYALLIKNSRSISVERVQFIGNLGALYLESCNVTVFTFLSCHFWHLQIHNTTFLGNQYGGAGAIHSVNSTVNITDSAFGDNIGYYWGALYFHRSPFLVERCQFHNNTALNVYTVIAGALAFEYCDGYLKDTNFKNNRWNLLSTIQGSGNLQRINSWNVPFGTVWQSDVRLLCYSKRQSFANTTTFCSGWAVSLSHIQHHF